MKQVYLINTNNRAAAYGVGTYINQIVMCLRQADSLRLTVVELDSDEKETVLIEKDNVRYLKIPRISNDLYNTYTDRYNRNISYLLSLYVKAEKECIFHFNYLHHASMVRCLKSRFPEASIVLTIHYFNWCLLLKGNTMLFRDIIYGNRNEISNFEQMIYGDYLQDKSFLTDVDKVICLSQYTYNLLCNDYEVSDSKIVSMVNGIRLPDTLLTEEDRRNEKRKLAFGEEEKVVLFVGRLDEIKGVSLLIHAFKRILVKLTNVRLLLVGDGNYDAYLPLCRDSLGKITFAGKVDRELLSVFYQIADVGVMPSFHEQCSYVAIEMMAYGVPLIGTDTTGLREMLEDECCVPITYAEDGNESLIDAFAERILAVLSSEQHKERRNKSWKYDLENVNLPLISFYLRM
ncbi:TIGR04157 family glycosyltransferase [uncultured Bacteroides sp.]|uniref:TIGR04157 family glycosyltransferase n=1 Tax=uncultured Bacteroides sp. TaxID=162156 RepID=UPI0025DDFDEB|nr:TIGR04157 family glycosyltransferase [uncultured Bacteroides sp.]